MSNLASEWFGSWLRVRLLPIHLGELTLLTVYCSVEKSRRKYISEWFLKKKKRNKIHHTMIPYSVQNSESAQK